MKNALIIAILGIAVVLTAGVCDYVYTEELYRERLNEKAVYAELGADPNRRYGGYSIEELCEGYAAPEKFLGKTSIDMEIINQYPQLPVGCEITCAAALLRYLGYDVDKCELASNYMKQSSEFTERNDTLYGPDPGKVFVGDPYGNGFGCYAPVIVNSLNMYFRMQVSDNEALSLENSNSADLEKLLDGGVPVIVWASIDMKPYRFNDASEWTVSADGKIITWLAGSHTLVLTGYDDSCYYFMDSNDKTEIQRYSKESFLARWEENGSQAVVVKLATES